MIHRKKNIIHITLSPLKMFPSVLLFIALKAVKIVQKVATSALFSCFFCLLSIVFCEHVCPMWRQMRAWSRFEWFFNSTFFYKFLTNVLNCSPRSSIFLKRSKLAQQGLNSTVSPGFAISKQALTQSLMLWVSRTGRPKWSKLSCNFWLFAPK